MTDNNKSIMTADQTNSGANRTGDAVTPPNQAGDESAESKKKKKKKKKKKITTATTKTIV